MRNIQNLLHEINVVNVRNETIVEATGGRFNMFSILGVNHYENTHSAIIAEILNPSGSHGLKEKFLQKFLSLNVPENFTFDCENASVETEKYIGTLGRVDIFIEQKDKRKAIIIENKIYAEDQSAQLKRYNEYAIGNYSKDNFLILYLTLDGAKASEDSCNGVEYSTISYSKNIIKWMEECAKISLHYPLVRETINQYINHVLQLTNQDMDTGLREEIIHLITHNKNNLKSAMAIGSCLDEVKSVIINNFVDRIAKKIKLERLKLPPQIAINEFGFIYKEKYYLYFGKDGGNTYVSIKTKDSLYGESSSVQMKLVLFDKKSDSFNPFGWSVALRYHWSNNPKVYEDMLIDESDYEKVIVLWIEKMIITIDDFSVEDHLFNDKVFNQTI